MILVADNDADLRFAYKREYMVAKRVAVVLAATGGYNSNKQEKFGSS